MGWDEQIQIDRPAAYCFDVATDLARCHRWQSQIEQIERLDAGPLRVGSRWRETRREGHRRHTILLEVFEHQPPTPTDSIGVHCAGAELYGLRASYRFLFVPLGEQTCRVEFQAQLQTRHRLLVWLLPLLTRMMRNAEAGMLTRLKAFCEAV